MNQLVTISSPILPALVAAAGEHAGMRFLEFFAANIRNPHTRRAGVPSIGAVQLVHVATWIEASTRELVSSNGSPPSVTCSTGW